MNKTILTLSLGILSFSTLIHTRKITIHNNSNKKISGQLVLRTPKEAHNFKLKKDEKTTITVDDNAQLEAAKWKIGAKDEYMAKLSDIKLRKTNTMRIYNNGEFKFGRKKMKATRFIPSIRKNK